MFIVFSLSSTIDADQATKNRVENSLTIFVAEAKNVASKKRFALAFYTSNIAVLVINVNLE